MYMGVCVYAQSHTHTARRVLSCEPRGRDETLGGPEESESDYICMRPCAQSTLVYIVIAGRRDDALD